jgi:hypothetical protein
MNGDKEFAWLDSPTWGKYLFVESVHKKNNSIVCGDIYFVLSADVEINKFQME